MQPVSISAVAKKRGKKQRSSRELCIPQPSMELTKPRKPRSEDEVSDEKDLLEIKYIGGGMLSE